MQTQAKPIRVWDLPTRIFHWSLAASFVIASRHNGHSGR